jgi:lipoprotein-releasing system ATP-binding protein
LSRTQGDTPLVEAVHACRVLSGEIPVTLVNDISLAVYPGEFVAITGPSGSGKSSLMYLLGMLDVPTSGMIRIRGQDTTHIDEDERAALRLASLGFVFQFHFLLPEFSALDNVTLPMRALGALPEAQQRARGMKLLGDLGLEAHAMKRPDQLSGGQRQRVAIARAMANDPPVILADEPTGNLDTASSEQVLAILRRLVDQEHRSVVIVTHDMSLAQRTDRRIHIVDGEIASDAQNVHMAEPALRPAASPHSPPS